jgi:hypothetical protein
MYVYLSCRFKRLQFDNHSLCSCFQIRLLKVSILLVAINKHEKEHVKYLQSINFSQLTLTVKNEIKNLRSAILNLVISQSLSTRKQAHVKKSNPALNVKHKWLSGCAK